MYSSNGQVLFLFIESCDFRNVICSAVNFEYFLLSSISKGLLKVELLAITL